MAKDHYCILGVSADATPRQIRAAYRREARRSHPDHAGGGSEPFLAVQEAYEVLSDPARRQAYDLQLARLRRDQRAVRYQRPEPLRRGRSPAEPLVPAQRPARRPEPLVPSSFESLISEIFRSPWQDIEPSNWTGAGRGVAEIQAEVRLSRKEALRGGRVRVRIPVQVPCPTCRGQGGAGFYPCLRCSGSGLLAGDYPLEVTFPAGVVDGSIGRVRLSPPGIGDLTLTLLFRVYEW